MTALTDKEHGRFWGAWQAWRNLAPGVLARQNALQVLALLEMCEKSGGSFQMEIASGIGLHESHLSKLVHKLVQAEWISSGSGENGRGNHRIRITQKGKSVLKKFGGKVGKIPTAPPVRHRRQLGPVRPAQGQTDFFDDFNRQFSETDSKEHD
jgi:predicted transcriptional regulator